MAATRTFDPITGGAAGGAYQAGDRWGVNTAEDVRQALDMAMYLPHLNLGGLDVGVITGAATWAPVPGYQEMTLNGDSLGGLTIDLVVWSYTSNASTAVQLRLRNVTDSSNAATSTSITSTSATKETVSSVTLASGVKVYRLEILGGATHHVYGWGHLRLRTTPA
jgi:hypothetical protein